MMKNGIVSGTAIVMLSLAAFGCQSRNFMNMGKDSKGREYGVPANTIDGYAKAHGISREEAAKRMRAELVQPSDSHADTSPIANAAASSETQTR
jgi:hypothetical protein